MVCGLNPIYRTNKQETPPENKKEWSFRLAQSKEYKQIYFFFKITMVLRSTSPFLLHSQVDYWSGRSLSFVRFTEYVTPETIEITDCSGQHTRF